MKNLKNNTLGVALLVVGLLVVTLGITYAVVLVYDGIEGVENSQLVLGDIYMHYSETNQLMLENAMPSLGPDESKYFEFTVSGKNTYTEKDIWYEIVLNHGDDHATRVTRIRDDLLKFRLVEIKDKTETVVLDGETYNSLNNQRIWVNTIEKNTTNDVEITYRLYMWIDYNTAIGNTSDADYDFDTWNNQVFGSIKVNVKGDFNEKHLPINWFDQIVRSKNTDNCSTYIEEDGITYISGTKDCIDFNYVWYSGKLWRITAIYPDGTMKMITDSAITSIGYGKDENFYIDDTNKSYMYQWLNEDFLDTLYNYQNIIVTDYKWNATSGNGTISYKLPTTVEEGATLVETPVGLLNSYEYYKSCQNVSYGSCYLEIGYNWWLLNSASSSNVWYASYFGPSGSYSPSNTVGARPSINLKSTIQLLGGSGTKAKPYKIMGDKENVVANVSLLNTRTSGEYVTFDGEDYRIVGTEIIDEKVTTKLNKVDYVRDESGAVITKKFASTITFGLSTNTQTDDYWDYYLNNTWLKSVDSTYNKTDGTSSMLEKGTYYLGKVATQLTTTPYYTATSNYKLSICATASNTVPTRTCKKTTSTWTGYVGLPRYGEMFASQQGNGYSSSTVMWLVTPYNLWGVLGASIVKEDGSGNANDRSISHGVRPTIHLNSEIIIKSGSGTKQDPFVVGLPN